MIGNIEKYFEPIEVERFQTVLDEWGNPTKDYGPHITIQGRIRQLNTDERISADKETVFTTHRLYCFPADIKATDRMTYKGKTYEVKGEPNDVMNFGRLMQIELEVVE
ncbi:phage head-tail adaptor, putative, SPP1 family [Anaerovirgula multivorans]|uniref:Phage head-tail adaptor, putative, SPP1 family n=1 Tax=Anaerovirgula multivorans TaxID=312168 RepID=A0A239AKJ0_9FIRM|nr:phage head closure protein [Anaerovirgula multivorans]SNR95508.1 phage head-tail adaptor, putative, SPP1 family [Anaerovirgula multivorans]